MMKNNEIKNEEKYEDKINYTEKLIENSNRKEYIKVIDPYSERVSFNKEDFCYNNSKENNTVK